MRSGFHFLHGQTKRRFRLGVLFVAAGFSLLHVTQHVFTNQGYTNDSNRNRLPDMDWYRSGRDGGRRKAEATVLLGILFFHEPATFWRLFFISTLVISVVGLKMV